MAAKNMRLTYSKKYRGVVKEIDVILKEMKGRNGWQRIM